MRRKRLLEKLNYKESSEGDEDEDFDAEAFFGIKESNLGGKHEEDEDLMLKAIQMMTADNALGA